MATLDCQMATPSLSHNFESAKIVNLGKTHGHSSTSFQKSSLPSTIPIIPIRQGSEALLAQHWNKAFKLLKNPESLSIMSELCQQPKLPWLVEPAMQRSIKRSDQRWWVIQPETVERIWPTNSGIQPLKTPILCSLVKNMQEWWLNSQKPTFMRIWPANTWILKYKLQSVYNAWKMLEVYAQVHDDYPIPEVWQRIYPGLCPKYRIHPHQVVMIVPHLSTPLLGDSYLLPKPEKGEWNPASLLPLFFIHRLFTHSPQLFRPLPSYLETW